MATRETGRCHICKQTVPVRDNGTMVTHKIKVSVPGNRRPQLNLCRGSDKRVGDI